MQVNLIALLASFCCRIEKIVNLACYAFWGIYALSTWHIARHALLYRLIKIVFRNTLLAVSFWTALLTRLHALLTLSILIFVKLLCTVFTNCPIVTRNTILSTRTACSILPIGSGWALSATVTVLTLDAFQRTCITG